jgi:N-acetylneuraminate synthase
MKELFNCKVGLSDHTLGVGVSVASVALGASVIEKHFTLSRADGGVDADFSLEPKEMKLLVDETNQAWESLGSIHYGLTEGERAEGRRSLYIAEDVKKGDVFTEKNVRSIRPGNGLETKYYDIIIGRNAKTDLKKGTPVDWDIL